MTVSLTRSDLPKDQQKLLDVILDVVGQRFEQTDANVDDIRAEMNCTSNQLRSHLRSLAIKGFLHREVRRGLPVLWRVDEAGGALPPPSNRCWECGMYRTKVWAPCTSCGASVDPPPVRLQAIY